jgi:hypothetical protein
MQIQLKCECSFNKNAQKTHKICGSVKITLHWRYFVGENASDSIYTYLGPML